MTKTITLQGNRGTKEITKTVEVISKNKTGIIIRWNGKLAKYTGSKVFTNHGRYITVLSNAIEV